MLDRQVSRKNTISLSPPAVIEKILHKNKTFFVVRDDLLPGGSKQRACAPFLEDLVKKGFDQFYYASPFAGFAQVALAYTCQQLGLKCVLYCEKDQTKESPNAKHEFTQLAESYGAKIIILETLDMCEKQAKREALMALRSIKIPLGFNCESFTIAFEKELRYQWTEVIQSIKLNPARIWLPVGSGTLASVFERILPASTEIMCVDVRVLAASDQRILSLIHKPRINLYSAPEYFHEPADLPPTIPSNTHYDAKIWQFLSKFGHDYDLWWNVAR